MGFSLSPEQQAIKQMFLAKRKRNLLINALAGTGKSSTLIELGRTIPIQDRPRVRFIAFNSPIVDELTKKFKADPELVNFRASTLHSMGRRAVVTTLGITPPSDWVDDSKYRYLAEYWMEQNGLGSIYSQSGSDWTADQLDDIRDGLQELVHFAMVTLTDPNDPNAIMTMAMHYGVVVLDWGVALLAVPQLFAWGMTGVLVSGMDGLQYGITTMISFDEMIYLAHALPNVNFYTYNTLFVDEAQDLSAMQRLLVAKLLNMAVDNPGHLPEFRPKCNSRNGLPWACGRAIFVADENQAIYGFTGAECDSVNIILREFACEVLPLTICWRCGVKIVENAQCLVPALTAAPNAIQGEIWLSPKNKVVELAEASDLIICRCVAPLVDLTYELLNVGKKAIMRGRDIGRGLKKIVNDLERIKGFSYELFRDYLVRYESAKIFNLSQKPGQQMAMQSIADRCKAVLNLYNRLWALEVRSLDGLRDAIDNLFDDDPTNKIMLSSVHKSKGLEAEIVWILFPSLMPHPNATQPWEIIQEKNLKYVADTRAIRVQYYITEEEEGVVRPFILPPLQSVAAEQYDDIFPTLDFDDSPEQRHMERAIADQAVRDMIAEENRESKPVLMSDEWLIEELKSLYLQSDEWFDHATLLEGQEKEDALCKAYEYACRGVGLVKDRQDLEPHRSDHFYNAAYLAREVGRIEDGLVFLQMGLRPETPEPLQHDYALLFQDLTARRHTLADEIQGMLPWESLPEPPPMMEVEDPEYVLERDSPPYTYTETRGEGEILTLSFRLDRI